MSVVLDSEGVLVEDRESILEVILKYNEVLLSRGQHNPEFEDLARLKREAFKELREAQIQDYDTLKWEEWEEIVEKVKLKGKKMFEDFLQSGEEWKS